VHRFVDGLIQHRICEHHPQDTNGDAGDESKDGKARIPRERPEVARRVRRRIHAGRV